MSDLGLLASVTSDNVVIGLRVFLVGFLGVVFCMSALALALKTAMALATRLDAAPKTKKDA